MNSAFNWFACHLEDVPFYTIWFAFVLTWSVLVTCTLQEVKREYRIIVNTFTLYSYISRLHWIGFPLKMFYHRSNMFVRCSFRMWIRIYICRNMGGGWHDTHNIFFLNLLVILNTKFYRVNRSGQVVSLECLVLLSSYTA